MSTPGTSATSRWRTGGIVLFCGAAFLLVSMGGAIIAAPLTVPLLFLVTCGHPTMAFRVTGAVLTAATVAEVAWALTFVVADEAKPWIWLVPLGAAFGAVIALAVVSDTRRHSLTRA